MVKISTSASRLRINSPIAAQIATDLEEMKRGVKTAVKNAIRTTRNMAREWKLQYFPIDTGMLMDMTTFRSEWVENTFIMTLKVDVDYASFVNEMRGVRWTNPRTVEAFFDRWVEFIQDVFLTELVDELEDLGTNYLTSRVIQY